jgi:cation:H+ antiporter
MAFAWLQLLAGLAFLLVGGEFLVRSSTKLALFLKLSPMVIGLTIVSIGTSFPELMVSLNAALGEHPDIAIGNVVGSNIANLALVLGLTAAIFPIYVKRENLTLDWPFMILASVLLIIFSWDLLLEVWEGLVFLAMLSGYTFWIIRKSRIENLSDISSVQTPKNPRQLFQSIIAIICSIGGLVVGADWLVEGSSVVARSLGLEERIIGLSIVAFGTSAPELATSMIAVYRKETGLSLGNLIGSNIFNILGILGVTAIVHPIQINPEILRVDYWWFLAIPVVLLPILLSRLKITRLEGVLLLLSYILYIFLLF